MINLRKKDLLLTEIDDESYSSISTAWFDIEIDANEANINLLP